MVTVNFHHGIIFLITASEKRKKKEKQEGEEEEEKRKKEGKRGKKGDFFLLNAWPCTKDSLARGGVAVGDDGCYQFCDAVFEF